MRQWVADDLAGPGATIRMMVRVFIPAVLILTPFWVIPMSLYLHLSTTLPILIPFVFFSHALNKVWRRHMLRKHGLDPGLVDYVARQRERPRPRRLHREVRTTVGPAEQPGRLRRQARRRWPSSSKACAQPDSRSVAVPSSWR